MGLGTWLDTAIGVALFFLAMSFLVSAVVEAIAQVFALRATTLREGIANLLNSVGMDASTKSGAGGGRVNHLSVIYEHSLMRGLYDHSSQGRIRLLANLNNGTLPSYVPGAVFATALLDTVTTSGPLTDGRNALAAMDAALRALRDAEPGAARDAAIDALKQARARFDVAIAAAVAEIGPAAVRGRARIVERRTATLARRDAATAAGNTQQAAALDALLNAIAADDQRLAAVATQWAGVPGDGLTAAMLAALDAAIDAPHVPGDQVSWNARMAGIDAAFSTCRDAARRVLDALAVAAHDTDRWLGEARALVERIEIPELRAALQSMITDAGATVDDLRKSVAKWFDESMDRVSGWYKRRTQWIGFVTGLVVAVTINADAINVFRKISTDEVLRQSLVQLSERVADKAEAERQAIVMEEGLKALPVGWYVATCIDRVKKKACLGDEHGPLATPWQDRRWVATTQPAVWKDIQNPDVHLNWSPLSILGWIITALAVKLGAPFWFDLMSSLLKIRSAGIVPKKETHAPSGGGAAP